MNIGRFIGFSNEIFVTGYNKTVSFAEYLKTASIDTFNIGVDDFVDEKARMISSFANGIFSKTYNSFAEYLMIASNETHGTFDSGEARGIDSGESTDIDYEEGLNLLFYLSIFVLLLITCLWLFKTKRFSLSAIDLSRSASFLTSSYGVDHPRTVIDDINEPSLREPSDTTPPSGKSRDTPALPVPVLMTEVHQDTPTLPVPFLMTEVHQDTPTLPVPVLMTEVHKDIRLPSLEYIEPIGDIHDRRRERVRSTTSRLSTAYETDSQRTLTWESTRLKIYG